MHDEQKLMRKLAAEYQPGRALMREFYTLTSVYEWDIANYWSNSWIWAGHVSQLAKAGDYFLVDFATESVIVTRDLQGEVRAFLNVCRHRGSRICAERVGRTRVFVCPYHAWSYGLDGSLRSARGMEADFSRTDFGLMRVHLRVFQGLIFICLGKKPPLIEDGFAKLSRLTAAFGLENLQVAHRAEYTVQANWKLALENYMECFHCLPAHQEYSRSHSLKDPKSMTPELVSAMQKKAIAAGLPNEEYLGADAENCEMGMGFYYRRYPLYSGYLSGSKSGRPVAPLLGDLTDFDGGATDIQIGILNNFLAYSDYVVGYRFLPVQLQKTKMEVVWMVRGGAKAGKDYELDDLTWLWHATSLEDERIITANQAGVNSQHFIPGPLNQMEWGIQSFYRNYIDAILR